MSDYDAVFYYASGESADFPPQAADFYSSGGLVADQLSLTPIPSSLFIKPLSSLTSVKLNYTNLNTEQTTAIIRAVGKFQNLETLGKHVQGVN